MEGDETNYEERIRKGFEKAVENRIENRGIGGFEEELNSLESRVERLNELYEEKVNDGNPKETEALVKTIASAEIHYEVAKEKYEDKKQE
ncbi:MAG: hypothetical protein ACLFQ8_02450 [Candidatus Aenigmatarchaeota archaeon]